VSFSYVAQLSCLLACLLVERAQAVEGIVAMRICCIYSVSCSHSLVTMSACKERSHVRMLNIACFLPFFPFLSNSECSCIACWSTAGLVLVI
jgi:hypothetical protein